MGHFVNSDNWKKNEKKSLSYLPTYVSYLPTSSGFAVLFITTTNSRKNGYPVMIFLLAISLLLELILLYPGWLVLVFFLRRSRGPTRTRSVLVPEMGGVGQY